jgi:hypothetical protein
LFLPLDGAHYQCYLISRTQQRWRSSRSAESNRRQAGRPCQTRTSRWACGLAPDPNATAAPSPTPWSRRQESARPAVLPATPASHAAVSPIPCFPRQLQPRMK